MTGARALLPDRTARAEAALYVLGTGLATVGFLLTVVFAPAGAGTTAAMAARGITAVVGLTLAGLALARRPRPEHTGALVLAGAGLTAAAAVATALLDGRGVSGTYLATMVLFAVAVRRCPPRVAVAAGLLALVAYVVSAVARSGTVVSAIEAAGGTGPAPRSTISDAVGLLVALLVGLLLRSGDGSRRVEALARVRAGERLLVARELHDLVARHVTGMVVRTQALTVVAPDLPAPARGALEDIEAAGNDALAAMRRMVGVLRAPLDGDGDDLEDLPTAAVDVGSAIRGAVDEAGRGAPVRVDVAPAVDDVASPPRELLTTVHRLVAEALTNVARHAPAASAVVISADRDGEDLVLAVGNDGAATPARRAPTGGGFGLVGMGERVRALGGSLASGPDGGDRWLLVARVPVRENAAGTSPS